MVTQAVVCLAWWLQAYQTLRKGNKKFAVYDLYVTLEWNGTWVEDGASTDVTGEVTISEFCSTNDPDEWEVHPPQTILHIDDSTVIMGVHEYVLMPASIER